jgi:hypothetical protein
MESVPQRLPLRTRLKIRLKIAGLRLLLRIVASRAFKVVLKPVLYAGLLAYACLLIFGHTPKRLAELNAQSAQLITRLEEVRNKPIRTNLTDREHAALRATTWGTAGAGVVIEVAIATSSKALGPTMCLAAACFAVTIPLLIAFGFVQSHQFDPARDRPTTTQEAINLQALIYGTQFLFCVGLTAMLFDFNRSVAAAFLVGCWLAWRSLKAFTIPPPSPEAPEKALSEG